MRENVIGADKTHPFYPAPAVIRAAVGLLEITNRQLCEAAHISPGTLSKLLARDRAHVTADSMLKVRDHLIANGVTWDDRRDEGGRLSVHFSG